MDFFEKINRECMYASGSAAPDPFSRENILSTLLSACGKGSAEYAFKLQIEKCGPTWLNSFFQGLSQVARENLNEESWQDLVAAYVHTAEISKANMQVFDVLTRNDVKRILSDGLVPLYRMFESDEIAKSIAAEINHVIALEYDAAGPSVVKIAEDQLKRFLTILSKEMSLKPPPIVAPGNQECAAS